MNAKLHLVAFLVGAVTATAGVYHSMTHTEGDVALEDFALGAQTLTVLSHREGKPIHVVTLGERSRLIESVDMTDWRTGILWLGNSQLHAINQPQPSDENSAAQLHDRLRPDGIFLQAMSFPNANFQEHLTAFVAFVVDRKPDVLLLSAVFDDTREDGLRPEIKGELLGSSALQDQLAKTEIGARLVEESLPKKELSSVDRYDTLQDRSEELLETALSKNTKFWNTRANLRGEISVGIYRFRNQVFGITAQSVRKVIPARYKRNLQALSALLEIARSQEVKVFLYIAPLRNDVRPPYDDAEYRKFKEDCQRIAKEHEATFFDAEELVDDRYWGTKDSTNGTGEPEYDFMHFQVLGHEQLAVGIEQAVRSLAARN